MTKTKHVLALGLLGAGAFAVGLLSPSQRAARAYGGDDMENGTPVYECSGNVATSYSYGDTKDEALYAAMTILGGICAESNGGGAGDSEHGGCCGIGRCVAWPYTPWWWVAECSSNTWMPVYNAN